MKTKHHWTCKKCGKQFSDESTKLLDRLDDNLNTFKCNHCGGVVESVSGKLTDDELRKLLGHIKDQPED